MEIKNRKAEMEYQHNLNKNFLNSILLLKSEGLEEEDAVKLTKIRRLNFHNVKLTENETAEEKRIEKILN